MERKIYSCLDDLKDNGLATTNTSVSSRNKSTAASAFSSFFSFGPSCTSKGKVVRTGGLSRKTTPDTVDVGYFHKTHRVNYLINHMIMKKSTSLFLRSCLAACSLLVSVWGLQAQICLYNCPAGENLVPGCNRGVGWMDNLTTVIRN